MKGASSSKSKPQPTRKTATNAKLKFAYTALLDVQLAEVREDRVRALLAPLARWLESDLHTHTYVTGVIINTSTADGGRTGVGSRRTALATRVPSASITLSGAPVALVIP